MGIQRLVEPTTPAPEQAGASDEAQIELTLRPQTFDDYIGQDRMKRNLRLFTSANLLWRWGGWFN